MLKLREKLAFGNQVDYFDDSNCIGWVLTGDYEHELSGLAVVMTNAQGAEKEMTISAIHGGETFVDILRNNEAKVVLDDTGKGLFPVNDGQVSIYVNEKLVEKYFS
jgi:alpha-amylase